MRAEKRKSTMKDDINETTTNYSAKCLRKEGFVETFSTKKEMDKINAPLNFFKTFGDHENF